MIDPPRQACRDEAPELFFPLAGDRAGRDAAIAVCRSCPALLPCREAGRNERYGVWGGVFRDGERPDESGPAPEPTAREPRSFNLELNNGHFEATVLEEWEHLRVIGFTDKEAAQALGIKVESLQRAGQRAAA